MNQTLTFWCQPGKRWVMNERKGALDRTMRNGRRFIRYKIVLTRFTHSKNTRLPTGFYTRRAPTSLILYLFFIVNVGRHIISCNTLDAGDRNNSWGRAVQKVRIVSYLVSTRWSQHSARTVTVETELYDVLGIPPTASESNSIPRFIKVFAYTHSYIMGFVDKAT